MAHDSKQVFRVPTVVNGERLVEPYAFGVFAQQSCPDTVEGPCPRQLGVPPPSASIESLAQHAPRSVHHVLRRPEREREKQDPVRVDSAEHEVCDAIRKRVGFARSGTCDDEQWPCLASL